jgi:acetolactate synthase-1/3 small subunit
MSTKSLYSENTDYSLPKEYTLSIFTENRIGLLNRITIIFTRRHVNIESITASESEVEGVYRYTIVIRCTREKAIKVVNQIEKLVEVLKAFMHEEQETVYQEIALYKISTANLKNDGELEKVVRDNHARILSVTPQYIVIEKTGHQNETQELYMILKKFHVLEFGRSGRVAVTKPMKELSQYLEEMEMINSEGINKY